MWLVSFLAQVLTPTVQPFCHAPSCSAGSGTTAGAGTKVGARTLDRVTRLGCIKARAAFWLAHHLTDLSPSSPLAGICSTCGQGTFSWCEGCYRRIGEESGRFFSAVCQHCDKEQLVCPCCQAAGVTWEAGHETYLADHGLQEEDQEGVEITPEDGGPPQRVTFAELGWRLGRSAEELKAEILGALGGGGCTDPSDP